MAIAAGRPNRRREWMGCASAALLLWLTALLPAQTAPGTQNPAPSTANPEPGTRRPEPKPLTLVSLAEIPRITDPQLAPDGRTVAYTLGRADWKANRSITHVWTAPIAGGAPLQMTNTEGGESLGRWSPDAASLSFVARGENGLQIFVVPAAGGPPRQLTRHATAVYAGTAPVWSADGRFIYFLAADAPSPAERERDRLRDDLFVYGANFKQRHLWRVAVADGAETRLTDGAFSVLSFRLSRDGSRIVQQRGPTPLIDDAWKSEAWTSDAAGGAAQAITNNGIEEIDAELSPDLSQLMFIAQANERLEPYYSGMLFTIPVGGGRPVALLPNFPHSIDHASWSPDGRSILAVVNMGVHSEVFRVNVRARTAVAMTGGQHSVQFWSLQPAARQMVMQLDEPTRIGDAWTLPVDGGKPARVTGIYDTLATEFALPRQELVTWKGIDGTTVEGLLFYPNDYQAGRRTPLVVQLHGGPGDSDKFGFGPGVIVNYVQVLTARGYAVLRPNYRGSAGYGNAFLRDIVGSYFKNMHLDVLAGIDTLVKNGIADPDRLAVMGWSAGGHLTNKLITVTTRFKAASSTAGGADWMSLFAQSDERAHRAVWFGGMPWGRNAPTEAFWNNSPLKDASSVKTPTLIVAGQEDARVPMVQGLEFFRALEHNGVPARLLVAPREGHQWGELRHQLAKANAELEWFEHYVNGRPYAWERAPGDPPGEGNSGIFR